MNKSKQIFFYLVLFSWILIIIVSYILNIKITKRNTINIITKQSAAFFEEIETTRLWNAKHGGVYVPITETTQPNPYLQVPNREIYIDSLGIALTKVNPAFMTRQIAELAKTNSKIQYHITSLMPIRPENKALEWERKSLESFENQTDYTLELYQNDTIKEYRYMAPLFVKKGCMKCHEKQGYNVGDIRGGISIRTPAEPLLEAEYLQKRNINLFHFFSMIIGILSLFLFKNYSNKKYKIVVEKNAELKQQKEEINVQSEKLLERNNLIENKNQQINSSIKYAKTIQVAILPRKKIIDEYLKTFIIFRPKDIVSGDFYWFKQIKDKNKKVIKTFFATVDCTGHGIPGAFLSIISSQLLNKIIVEHKINRTKEILTVLNDEIIAALKQSDTKNIDGLDISLCAVFKTPEGVKIEFSGAKLPVYYYKKTDKKIVRIKGDSKHIGGIIVKKDIKREFTTKEILLQNDDMLYLATDGYIDQNNEARKRFGTPRFVETLTEIAEKTLAEQKEILETKLDNWQNNTEQRDDITLIGIKI